MTSCESSKTFTVSCSRNVSSELSGSCAGSTDHTLAAALGPLHFMAKWLGLWHFLQVFPKAGQSSLLWKLRFLPQLWHSQVIVGGAVGESLVSAPCDTTSFNCIVILSVAWHTSSVHLSVSVGSRSSCSRVLLSRIPKTRQSLRISSGVIASNIQLLRSAVQY